jgi:hypothetical protein
MPLGWMVPYRRGQLFGSIQSHIALLNAAGANGVIFQVLECEYRAAPASET